MSTYKQLKKYLIVFILLLSLFSNSFAAIVSDNDGSAFVTKKEFEALKKDFDNQIYNYNNSIDNKIDGAIASYLAGIKFNQVPEILYNKYIDIVGMKPTFLNSLPGTGQATNKSQISINVLREEAVNKFSNLNFATSLWTDANYRATADSCLYFGSAPNWDSSYNSWTQVWLIKQLDMNTVYSAAQMDGALSTWTYWRNTTSRTSSISSYESISDKSSDGSGQGFIYQNIGGGKVIKFYDTKIFPNINIDCIAHRYLNCAALTASYYTNSTGKSDNTTITLDVNKLDTYGNHEQGTKVEKKSTTNATYANIKISKLEVNDSINYMNFIFAKNTNQDVYCIDEDADLVAASATSQIVTDTTYWYDLYYTGAGGKTQTNSMSGVTVKYYPLSYDVEQLKVNSFYNYYVSNIAGERVYNGEGFPVIRAESADTSCELKIKFISNDGNIEYKISDKKFIDGEFDTSAVVKESGEVSSGAQVSVNIEGLKKDQKVWVNCNSKTDGKTASIDNVSVNMK